MKASWCVALLLPMAFFVATPAHASPMLFDPDVGVLGDNVDPPPSIFDATFFTLGSCPGTLGGFFCAPFRTEILDDDEEASFQKITSLDFIFLDSSGMPIPFDSLHPADASAFPFLTQPDPNDPFTVRLSSGEGPLMCSSNDDNNEELFICHQLEVFSSSAGSVSVRAVNMIPNENLPAIPEPSTLVLLGSALLIAGRTLLRKPSPAQALTPESTRFSGPLSS